jgi:hypothetical protein
MISPDKYLDIDDFVEAYVKRYEFCEGRIADDEVYEEAGRIWYEHHEPETAWKQPLKDN